MISQSINTDSINTDSIDSDCKQGAKMNKERVVGIRLRQMAMMIGAGMLVALSAHASIIQSQSFEYDALGRLTKVIDADNNASTYTYDANGNRLSSTDALGNSTRYAYDPLNRVTQTIDAANGSTSYGYDGQDHLIRVTDARNLTTRYSYNGLGDLLAQSSPDTGNIQYSYNEAGQQSSRTNNASQTTTISRDALGRPTAVTYADGRVVSYVYDQNANGQGRLSRVYDSLGGTQQSEVSWTYDAQGRVLTRTQRTGAAPNQKSYMLSYQYNSSGQLTQLTTPSGRVLSYTYDSQGRVQGLSQNGSTVLNAIQYRPFGAVQGWTWGNGQGHLRNYDQNGRLDTLTVGNNVKDLAYDAASRLIGISDLITPAQSSTYGYDNVNRINSYARNTETRSWAYDAVGNRTAQSIGTATENYSYSNTSNQLVSKNHSSDSSQNRSYSYTSTGHTQADTRNSYSYDARERLVSVSVAGGASAGYTLNPLGQRVQKIVNGVATHFIYDDSGNLVAEADNSGTINREYLYLGNVPVAYLVSTPGQGTAIVVDDGASGYSKEGGEWTLYPATSPAGDTYGSTWRANDMADTPTPAGIWVDDDNANNVAPSSASYDSHWGTNTNCDKFSCAFFGGQHTAPPSQGAPSNGIEITDAQAVFTGSWGASNCIGHCEGPTAKFATVVRSGNPTATATWNFEVPAAGQYDIYASWPSGNYFVPSTGANYTVHQSGGDASLRVQQDGSNGSWYKIGTFAFDQGASWIRLDNLADPTSFSTAIVHADNIVIAPAGSPRDGHYHPFVWAANLPEAGEYEVYTFYANYSSYAALATYTVEHANGSSAVTKDVSQDEGTFVSLGRYTFNAGLNRVSLSGKTGGFADVIKFSKVGAPATDYTRWATWRPTLPHAGRYAVYVRWPANTRGMIAWTPSTAAIYGVTQKDGSEIRLTQDQSINGGKWNLLGEYELDPGNAKVRLYTGRVLADAVQFVPIVYDTVP